MAEPIRRILVANRGEIARRVFRTAHAMGCSTVAVYADGDRHAPFVNEADLAVPLVGTTAAETYLDTAKLLAAAAASGADAVHPGYGFLSENADFARAVVDAGLTWIGPPPEAIAAMGDKLAAKETMIAAGVPTLPSLRVAGDSPTEEELAAAGLDSAGTADGAGSAASGTGGAGGSAYPLMVKASAGGGGKGMRVVENPAGLPDAIAAARREAAGAFGDDTVFVERCLVAPRHVEVQVLGDLHGNLVHFFERECSIQRRHQKVIEEAPSPVVTPALRQRLGQAALVAVGTLGYSSAGTVEFLLIGEGDEAEFFFLEINTRLQVEHPVTEAITGFDLVREQIRIAAGEPLGYEQDDLSISGWAIEARLYAEDPLTGFLPSTGTLDVWSPATAGAPAVSMGAATTHAAAGAPAAARFDSGVEQGSVIGTEFDPMLAKVIKHAPTRNEAALGLALALANTRIGGVTTNRDFLVAALRHNEFLTGRTDTDFIERTGLALAGGPASPDGSASPGGSAAEDSATGSADGNAAGGVAGSATSAVSQSLAVSAAAVALVSAARNRRDAKSLAFMSSGFRNSAMPGQVLPLSHGSNELAVNYQQQRDKSWDFTIGGGSENGGSENGGAANDGSANDGSESSSNEGSAESFSARIIGLSLTTRGHEAFGHGTPGHGTFGHGAPGHSSQIDGGGARNDIDAVLDAEIAGLRGIWRISAVGNSWYVDGPAHTSSPTTGLMTGSVMLTQRSRFPQLDANAVEGGLTAPMPGKIISVDVSTGDAVTTGQVLVVMEAMKMEHQIAAPADGTITEVRASVNDQVDNGELLVVITADS